MSETLYVARAEVRKVEGLHRRARLATGHEVDFGVHGPIKEFYRLGGDDLPLPVDYLVAGTGA
jgi:hypothetical protein